MKIVVLATLVAVCLSKTKTDTSLRDVIGDLQLYSQDSQQLEYVSVKINDLPVDTFFHFFGHDRLLPIDYYLEALKINRTQTDHQPNLDYKVFFVTIFVLADIESKAIFKIFLGPKNDRNGSSISLMDNWLDFEEVDLFEYKLTRNRPRAGHNTIVRSPYEFYFRQADVLMPVDKFLEDTPDVSGGIPFQFIVLVYPKPKPGNRL